MANPINILREAYESKKLDKETGEKILVNAKKVICSRRDWCPPAPDLYSREINHWLEELMLTSYRLVEIYLHGPKTYLETDFLSQSVSLLLFCATQMNQLDVVLPVINRIVQDLTCPNLILPFFVAVDHYLAVSLIIDTYGSQINKSILLSACCFLCKYRNFNDRILPILDTLDYPEQVSSIRVQLELLDQSIDNLSTCLQKCNLILDTALTQNPNSFQLHYNKSYVCALGGDKQGAFDHIKKSISICPFDSRIALLAMRILRSNNQPSAAIRISDVLFNEFRITNKWISIEKLYSLAEKQPKNFAISNCDQLLLKYPNDIDVLSSMIRLCLMKEEFSKATELMKKWESNSERSSDFYFYFSQLCMNSKEYDQANEYIKMAIDIEPENAEYHCMFSCYLYLDGNFEQGKEEAKLALILNPNYKNALEIYLKCLQDDEAEQSEIDRINQRIRELEENKPIDLSNIDLMLFQCNKENE
ncbi:TPR Domain containing protein [Histomonas meleagridis]|uniref:TPR Domain containing protein n=1 Tax=Histomonas meleagridis TaxID=135588 RepID=UPI00355A6548|nr:TPR Domain containing protein [Histomonas meleagridis]KAH0799049.1 TPR Domain containing protein [Histomonas meleagridis]